MGTALQAPGVAPSLRGLSVLTCKACTTVSALFSREVGQSFNQQTVPEPHLAGTEQGGVQGGADRPVRQGHHHDPRQALEDTGLRVALPSCAGSSRLSLPLKGSPAADPGPSRDTEKRGHCSLSVGEASVGGRKLGQGLGPRTAPHTASRVIAQPASGS